MAPTRPSLCLCPCLVLAAAAAGVHAEPAGAEAPVPLRVELSSAPPVPVTAGADGRATAQEATQTVVWTDRERWSLGLGVEQRWRRPLPGGPGLQWDGQNALVGLSVPTGRGSRLAWQVPLADGGDAPVRVSWSFRTHDPYRDLFRGSLMKVEFSGQTSLSLRARGGRLGLMLTSRW